MAFPSPDDYRAKTGRGLEVQTDKDKFKIVPCTYAGCDIDLVVNTFYAPAKGKCSRHNGSAKAVITASHLTHTENTDAAPNGALARLSCPLCEMPMMVVSVTEGEGRFITFRCAEGLASTIKESQDGRTRRCGTSVTVKPNWAAMEMKNIPTKFAEFIRNFNLDQAVHYFDLKEARDG